MNTAIISGIIAGLAIANILVSIMSYNFPAICGWFVAISYIYLYITNEGK